MATFLFIILAFAGITKVLDGCKKLFTRLPYSGNTALFVANERRDARRDGVR